MLKDKISPSFFNKFDTAFSIFFYFVLSAINSLI
jgi:hypothetical protein